MNYITAVIHKVPTNVFALTFPKTSVASHMIVTSLICERFNQCATGLVKHKSLTFLCNLKTLQTLLSHSQTHKLAQVLLPLTLTNSTKNYLSM